MWINKCIATIALLLQPGAGAMLSGRLLGGSADKEMAWYKKLKKSSLNPPDGVFFPVWTLLYFSLGLVAAWVWQTGEGRWPFWVLFEAQLLLNWLWSPLFFRYKQLKVALLVMLLMVALTLWMAIMLHPYCAKASYLLLPYLVWISFASYLTFYVVRHN